MNNHNLVIWRFHDNWHINRPDGLLEGITLKLKWKSFVDPQEPALFHLPPVSLLDLVTIVKKKLSIKTLRIVGNPEMVCQRVGIRVGASGSTNQITFLRQANPDVLICGEIAEWETSEYMRDAITQGQNKALIITGHANSEEPGMGFLIGWLNRRFPDIVVHHIPVGDPFIFI